LGLLFILRMWHQGAMANRALEPTAHQRRWRVPASLRAAAAAQAQR
jgi:hypothetical protein